MPNSFAGLAQRFPAEKEGQSVEEQVRELRDYSYQLLEYLRYALQNLEPSNFNEQEMSNWITKPIAAQIADVNGNMSQLALTAEGLAVRVENAEGSVAQLQLTTDGLDSTVGELGGKYTKLQQTVDGFDIVGDINNILDDGVAQVNFIFDNEKVGTIAQNGSYTMIMQSNGELLFTAKDGDIQLNSDDNTSINAYGDVDISGDVISLDAGNKGVQIWVSSSRYWTFSTGGIYYCESDGTVLSHVSLVSN